MSASVAVITILVLTSGVFNAAIKAGTLSQTIQVILASIVDMRPAGRTAEPLPTDDRIHRYQLPPTCPPRTVDKSRPAREIGADAT